MDPFAWMDHPLALPATLCLFVLGMEFRHYLQKRRLRQIYRELEAECKILEAEKQRLEEETAHIMSKIEFAGRYALIPIGTAELEMKQEESNGSPGCNSLH